MQSTTMDRKARFKAVDREFDLATRLPPDRRVALARLWYHDGQLSETGEEGEPVILMRRLDPTPVHDLPIEQLHREEAIAAFDAWRNDHGKIRY